jgi:hypothetical protein
LPGVFKQYNYSERKKSAFCNFATQRSLITTRVAFYKGLEKDSKLTAEK